MRTSQPTVSRHITQLEDRLKVSLFRRLPHGIILTAAGERIYGISLELEKLFRKVEVYATATKKASGLIRLWVTDGIGAYWLPPKMTDFYEKYPDIKLEVMCSEKTPDINVREADIAVSYIEPVRPDLVALSSYEMKFSLFASKDYIKRNGKPKTLDEIKENHFICDRLTYMEEWPEWAQVVLDNPKVIYKTDSSMALLHMTKAGIGIGLNPIAVEQREDDLVKLDVGFEPTFKFWLVCHRDAKDIPRNRALINHLKEVSKTIDYKNS